MQSLLDRCIGIRRGGAVAVHFQIATVACGAQGRRFSDTHNLEQRRAAHLSERFAACILVVDDNADAAIALSILLELEGHSVEQARDGVEGFEVAKRQAPQIAILDLNMPRRNGFELARLIKAEAWGRSVVLIALSAYDERAVRSKAAASGFDMFCRKPIDPSGFQDMIQRVASRISKADETAS